MGRGGHAGFADIEFGFADAEKESAENPDLLLNAYLDETHLVDKALKGVPFLVLGYKGSGKTAIAERANLLQETEHGLIVSVEQLGDFSYSDFKAAAGNAPDHQTRYPTTWGYLLLLGLLKSLERDEAGRERSPQEYHQVVHGLSALGLMPVPKLGELVTRSTKKQLKGGIPNFLEAMRETVQESHDLRMTQMVSVLQQAAEHFRTANSHVIFLDGLDAVISQRELQFQSLSALMRETDRLNNHFKRRAQLFKFVVLCRTDIFDRLPGANTNKIRQDSTIELDWYDDPRHPERTRLIKLANVRARASLHRRLDVFSEYLPLRVDNRAIRTFLLDHTRHTPRDLLQLLKRIQAHADDAERLAPNQVKAGVRDYSSKYFLAEIRNELAGYLADADIEKAITLLTSFTSPRLTPDDLRQRAEALGYGSLDLDALTSALFNCSALGTLEETPGKAPLYTFKYRNRTASLVPGSVIWVHPGAWKGLNIETKKPPGRGHRGGQQRRSARKKPG
jgi:hypothetical protein